MAKKTYKEKALLFQDPEWRSRADMCIREQAHVHAQEDAPAKADMKALGMGIVSGMSVDIEAVMASVVNWPGAENTVDDDEALKSIVNSVWPLVASARYPGAVELMNQIALSRTRPAPRSRSLTTVIPPTMPVPAVPAREPETSGEEPVEHYPAGTTPSV